MQEQSRPTEKQRTVKQKATGDSDRSKIVPRIGDRYFSGQPLLSEKDDQAERGRRICPERLQQIEQELVQQVKLCLHLL